LDLGSNDMIVHNNTLASIVGEIYQGFNASGTPLTGNGLTSSAAASTSNTALGAEANTSGTGALVTTFDGQTVTSTDILVKYTYFGDADLSGTINATDYQLIDNGFNTGGTPNGWFSGDFNYDGVVNGDDYTLIDNAFNTQGNASFAAVSAQPLASNAAMIFGASPTTDVAPALKPVTKRNSVADVPPSNSNPSNVFSTSPIKPDDAQESIADQILALYEP
jgi:hypothetical protein